MIHELPDIDQPKEKRDYITQGILDALGDQQSRPFYLLLASKVPERVIRYALAEIKADGARYPERVFTQRMQKYALAQLKQRALEPTHPAAEKRPYISFLTLFPQRWCTMCLNRPSRHIGRLMTKFDGFFPCHNNHQNRIHTKC